MLYTIQISSQNEWDSVKSIFSVNANELTPFGENFTIEINNTKCLFFHGGASKTRSSAACQYAIDQWKPKRHFLIGTAGGVATEIKVLDIIIAKKTALYDYIFRMGEQYEFIPKETIIEIDNSWINFRLLPIIVKEGFIASADQDVDYATRKKLNKEKVLVADWESASVALICKLNNTPCCVIRGVSDIPYNSLPENANQQYGSYENNTALIIQNIIEKILINILK